ncbi:c-type cytochrome biogenesis protein CcmI [Marinobacter sp.]|uniref:c-type cytochrome biogenesis protein CcmI n=1 Tax=Marinobacter sp. TaxID=50741 RepID=UPI00384AAEB1
MTTTFWLAATVLIGLALAFILFPLFFRQPRERAETDREQQNLLAYRGRMAELDAEYEAGNLDADNYRQLKDELAGSLLDEVDDPQTGRIRADYRRTGAVLVVIASLVLVPLVSVFLYQQWGALDDVENWIAMQEVSGTDQQRASEMSALADQLRDRMVENPDNPDGWAMLGRTYMSLERYGDAAWAFERLANQVSDNSVREATAWGLSAQARYFESRGAMDEEVTRAIEKARSLNPDEVNALGLLGINAFEKENYEQAIGYWERIAEVAPEHPQLRSIREGIAAAYGRLGREMPVEQKPADLSDRGVTVQVELDPAFAGEVPADTTLFVFARRPNGQGAPLAIARLTAGDLPARLRLDDAMSMSPSARISEATEVVVTARLSRSGSATPEAGDWQGRTESPVAVGADADDPASLVIDKRLR